MQERDPHIDDPYATTAMLSGLETLTKYRVHIWARTAKGRGEGYFIEITTTRAGGRGIYVTLCVSDCVCWDGVGGGEEWGGGGCVCVCGCVCV